MGFLSSLFSRTGENKQPALSEDELIAKLKDCKAKGIPVHHRIHGDLKVTRVLEDCFFADSDVRENLMFPYKYFSDGLLSFPEDAAEKTDGGAW